MGQRHQIYILAKGPDKRYRLVAAAHHQWLYGEIAVRQCLHLIEIFRASGNRRALLRENAWSIGV